MEGDQNFQNQQASVPQSSGVSFPTVNETPKKSGGAKTLLIIGILVLVAILGFVIYKSATKNNNEVASTEPTPYDNLTEPVANNQVLSATSTPAPSATPSTDRSKVAIQVQNGTGISGEAAYLQTQLGKLGYTDIKVGNASSTGATVTTVSFSSSLDSGVVAEITAKLKTLYTTVTTTSSTSTTYDVVIVTGLRTGATPKPSATATPKPSTSPTPTPTPTPSGSH